MYFKLRRFHILTFIFLSANYAFAQKNDSAFLKIDSIAEVNVVDKYNSKDTRSISPTQEISAKEFSSISALQASDAVKYFSGVTVKDYGGIGGLKTVSVRGFSANQTAISYDGIKVSDMQTGQIDIGRFSLDNVSFLTLNNGQNDDIFQPASLFASASVLNIKTLQPVFRDEKTFNAKFGIKAGSFGLINPSFLVEKKLSKKHSLSLNGDWLSANGKYPFTLNYGTTGNDSAKIRKNTDVKNIHLETTLYSNLSDTQKGYLKASFYNSERGLPGAIIYYNDNASASQRLAEKDFFVQTHYTSKLSKHFDFQANAKYDWNYTQYTDTSTLNTSRETKNLYVQQEIFGSLGAIYKPALNLSVSASTDLFINKLDANLPYFVYPTRISSLSALAGKYINDWFNFTTSLLYTNTHDEVKSGTAFENQQKLSPYAGFSIKPLKKVDFHLRAFYKNIFRLPTFNDLYYTYFGSRDLKPEDTNQFDIGTTYYFSNRWVNFISITADAYHNEVNNKIVTVPNKNLFIWSMTNYGKVEINGFDAAFTCNFNLTDSINLTINNSFTYLEALNKTDPTGGTYNNQLPYTPRFSGAGSAVLDLNFLTLSYSLIWSGKRYAGFQNLTSNRLESYVDQNISISRNFYLKKCVLETSFQLLNMMNENYEIVKNFPMQGRSFRISLSIKL